MEVEVDVVELVVGEVELLLQQPHPIPSQTPLKAPD